MFGNAKVVYDDYNAQYADSIYFVPVDYAIW
jgi:hypothetical protein